MSKTTLLFLLVIFFIIGFLFFKIKKGAPAYQNATFKKFGSCDVCKYALNDTTPHDVEYCSMCNAWICKKCVNNIPLRAVAMANRSLAVN